VELPTFPTGTALRNPDSFQRPPGAPEYTDRLGDHGDMELLLDEADRRGILDVPAQSARAARAGSANLVREGVIAERLWLLGYLRKQHWVASSTRPRHREAFLLAVSQFQHDAGLKADQWSGDKTWQTLQRLVTFESATHVDDYCPGGVPCAALNRALRLRLWTLGLLADRPRPRKEHDRVPTTGLKRFWTLWQQFGDMPLDAPQPPQGELIALVFDQDRLLRNIAGLQVARVDPRAPPVFRRRQLPGEQGDESALRTAAFLSCVAKIELWLLGFQVDISDQRGYPVFGVATADIARHTTLRSALKEFWDRLGGDQGTDDTRLSAKEARLRRHARARLREFVTPELFIALHKPEALGRLTLSGPQGANQTSPAQAADYSLELSDEINTDARVRATWAAGKRLGMKLWDGMRRLWRWIKRGIRTLLRIGENIVRGFFRYAMKAFEIGKLAVGSVLRATRQYLTGRLHDTPAVQVRIQKDGDLGIALRDTASPAESDAASRSLRYFGASFRLSCRILALLVRSLRMVVLGIFGWARLLWALVRAYRDIRPLYKALQALPAPEAPQAP
jgi:hypothetical protein